MTQAVPIQLTQLWLKRRSAWFNSDSTLMPDLHGRSTLTRLIWVRLESNLTHDSWVEHNPGLEDIFYYLFRFLPLCTAAAELCTRQAYRYSIRRYEPAAVPGRGLRWLSLHTVTPPSEQPDDWSDNRNWISARRLWLIWANELTSTCAFIWRPLPSSCPPPGTHRCRGDTLKRRTVLQPSPCSCTLQHDHNQALPSCLMVVAPSDEIYSRVLCIKSCAESILGKCKDVAGFPQGGGSIFWRPGPIKKLITNQLWFTVLFGGED